MPSYSLNTTLGPLDLAPYGWTARKDERTPLLSVGSSRVSSEPIDSPAGLQRDAIRAAERVALDLLAATGVAQRVEVVKTLADGTSRVDASAFASLDSRTPGRAIVESHDRGARSVAIAAIVETTDGRDFSALVKLAASVARRVAEGESEADVVSEVAQDRGQNDRAVADLVRHGVAIASAQADRLRRGDAPLVALVPSVLVSA